ncbi:MAG TPA: hypothetical protein VMV43_05205 [Candidatus Nanopelagicaceae bacterium]|nr:hypothetical protein [Candidatus Nanopelagicaceae bacterium]
MDIKEANELIAHASELVDYQVSKRGLLETQLFPVTAYICVSFYNAYDMLYDILKKISEKTTPEIMGRESRKILSEIHALSIFYIPLYYMVGRMGEIQRNGADPRSESPEKREQTLFVLDFWKRLATSYFKDEKLSVYDSNKKNMVLDHSTVEKTLNNVVDLSKEEVIKLKRTVANLEVVSFLDECEARAKICDHGPYKISDNESLVFREISHLYDGGSPHFPWSETNAKAPFSNIAFAFRLKDVEINFDDFATIETIPQDFADNITGVALLTRSGEKVKNLDLNILDSFKDYSERANKELFLKFSKWDRKQRLIAGAYAYCYGYARYTNFVGITGDINWDLTEKTMNTYVPMFMESDFDPGIPRLFRSKSKKKKEGPSLFLLPEE